jgi:hypothetical protein
VLGGGKSMVTGKQHARGSISTLLRAGFFAAVRMTNKNRQRQKRNAGVLRCVQNDGVKRSVAERNDVVAFRRRGDLGDASDYGDESDYGLGWEG